MMGKYNINQTTLKILSLYRADYAKSLHLREISRETKIDVNPISHQLKRLEERRILKCIEKGRNREYSLDLTNTTTPYYMTMAEAYITATYLEENFLIKRLMDSASQKTNGIILLFGSYATGTKRRESDIDLFLIVDPESSRETLQREGHLLNREINVKTSDADFFREGLRRKDPLIMEVLSDHITLKGIDPFCNLLWSHYAA